MSVAGVRLDIRGLRAYCGVVGGRLPAAPGPRAAGASAGRSSGRTGEAYLRLFRSYGAAWGYEWRAL